MVMMMMVMMMMMMMRDPAKLVARCPFSLSFSRGSGSETSKVASARQRSCDRT
jgi:hypothetical protein